MKKYSVGDVVWATYAERREVSEPCAVCFGKLKVTLTLGNGDAVELPCDYCGKGYSYPQGFVREYRFTAGAEQKTIEKVSIQYGADGEQVQYQSGCHILYPDRVFDTKEEAIKKCGEIIVAMDKEQITRAEYIKADVKKTFAWNAGYHLREAKNLEERAARHRERAVLCKAKSKKGECADE